MPLESCMILLDCSQYMRNGDYVPSRLEAQQDAANLLVGAKTQSHPESTVGISAGTHVLVSPTDKVGDILHAIHDIVLEKPISDDATESSGADNIAAAVSVASLALKHRRNKNGGQRIILFVGTPLGNGENDMDDDENNMKKVLQKTGKQLKKNNVQLDVILLGELDTNEPKLQELVNAANGRSRGNEEGDAGGEVTCHLVTIPTGVLPSDVLASSPVLADGGGAFAAAAAAGGAAFAAAGGGAGDAGAAAGGGGFGEFGGVDPNMDPELAMALRVSMEEERARQERVAAAAAAAASAQEQGGGEDGKTNEEGDDESKPAAATEGGGATADTASATAAAAGLSEEEALLQQALAMSMNENEPTTTETKDDVDDDAKPSAAAAPASDAMDMDDDEDLQMALQMSMQQQQQEEPEGGTGTTFQDPAFVQSMLQDGGSSVGDPNDPEIQRMLKKAKKDDDDDKDKKDDDNNDK